MSSLRDRVRLNLHRAVVGKYAVDNCVFADVRNVVLLSTDEDGIDVVYVLTPGSWDDEMRTMAANNGFYGWTNGVMLD